MESRSTSCSRLFFHGQLIAVFLVFQFATIWILNVVFLHTQQPPDSSSSSVENTLNFAHVIVAPENELFRKPISPPHNDDSAGEERSYEAVLERLNRKIERLHPPLNQSRPIELLKQPCNHKKVPDRFPNQTSSIEFIGCCGLGHRLARMANAAHLSDSLRIPLYGWWGCCDNQRVFDGLFGAEPLHLVEPFIRPANDPQHYQVRFDVMGHIFGLIRRYKGMQMKRNHIHCPARTRKVQTDFKFYSMLRERYTRKHLVDAFVEENFGEGESRKFAIAMHIRAGNGEDGDFKLKMRFIKNKDAFMKLVVRRLKIIMNMSEKPAVVFVATDTPSYIETLRVALGDGVPVVDLPQVRIGEGAGVMFGQMNKVKADGESCMDGWHGALMDMFIMSHADVVFAPKPSAFTETIPLSLVLGREDRVLEASFCEPAKQGELACFRSVQEWSCKTSSGKSALFDTHPQYSFL